MSDLIEDFERLREEHLDEIHRVLDEVAEQSAPDGSSLVEMCRYHMQSGGKRLRALLPLAVAEALDVEPARLVPFGAACETLHNATLVHDDLQDGDRMRRGEEAVWVRFGEARAVNLGDAMLYWTLLLVARLDATLERRERASQRLLRETIRVIDGQEREFLLKESQRPGIDEYTRMVEGKTSGLFALPVAGAAELCGAPPTIVARLEEAADHLGILFQIQDDVLDLYGDKGRQSRGMDVCEGKISALVVHFLEHGRAEDVRWLRGILEAPRDEVGPDEIDRVVALFREQGSLRFALDEIERRRRLACEIEGFDDYPGLGRLVAGMAELFLRPISAVVSREE